MKCLNRYRFLHLVCYLTLLLTVLATPLMAAQERDDESTGLNTMSDTVNDIDNVDRDRPWMAAAIASHPDTEQWRAQILAHRNQPRTPGWVKYEAHALSQNRDVLAMPTFLQMQTAARHTSRLMVRLKPQIDPLMLAETGLIHERALTRGSLGLNLHLYRFPAELEFSIAIELSNRHPLVLYAEPDYEVVPAGSVNADGTKPAQ